MAAWQQFCTLNIVVEAADVPAALDWGPATGPAPASAPVQGSEGGLHQHRLPQLGSRMQALLIKAGSAWCGMSEGERCHAC